MWSVDKDPHGYTTKQQDDNGNNWAICKLSQWPNNFSGVQLVFVVKQNFGMGMSDEWLNTMILQVNGKG